MDFLAREERWSFFSRGMVVEWLAEEECGSRVEWSSGGKKCRTGWLSDQEWITEESRVTVRSRIQLRQFAPPLRVLLAVSRHALEGIELRRRGWCFGGFAHAGVVAEDGVQRTFVDAISKGAEARDVRSLVLAQRIGREGVVFLVDV